MPSVAISRRSLHYPEGGREYDKKAFCPSPMNGLLFLEVGGVAVPEGGVFGNVLVVGAAFKGCGGVHVDAGGDEFHVAGNVVALFFIGVGDVDATQEVDGAKAFVGGGDLGGDFALGFFVDGNQLPAERGKIAGGDVYHVFEDGKVAEVDVYLTGIGSDGRSTGGGEGGFFKGVGDDLHGIALVEDAPFARQFVIAGIDDVKDIAGVAHHVGEQDVVEAGETVENGTGLLAAAHFVVFVVDFTESGFRVGTVVAFGVIDGDGGFLGAGVAGDVGGVFEIAFVVEGHGDVVVVDVGDDVAEHFFVDEELPVDVDFADAVGDGAQLDDDAGFVTQFVCLVFRRGIADSRDAHNVNRIFVGDAQFEIAVHVGGDACHGAEQAEVGKCHGFIGFTVYDHAFQYHFSIVLGVHLKAEDERHRQKREQSFFHHFPYHFSFLVLCSFQWMGSAIQKIASNFCIALTFHYIFII